jgi:hypothetical protein
MPLSLVVFPSPSGFFSLSRLWLVSWSLLDGRGTHVGWNRRMGKRGHGDDRCSFSQMYIGACRGCSESTEAKANLLAYALYHAQSSSVSSSYAISEVPFSMLVVVTQTCVEEWGAI